MYDPPYAIFVYLGLKGNIAYIFFGMVVPYIMLWFCQVMCSWRRRKVDACSAGQEIPCSYGRSIALFTLSSYLWTVFVGYPILVRFDVITVVTMNIFIVLDVTPCSVLKVYRRFGGTDRFDIQDRRVSQSSNRQASSSKTACLFLPPNTVKPIVFH
jgi:hypothetical protein